MKKTWRSGGECIVTADMFSSQTRIDSKTGADDLGRFEYLQALVTEFQDTDKQGEVNLKLCFLTVAY